MKIEIENVKLAPIGSFLYNLNLVRKQSRMRRRFIGILDERNEKYLEELRAVQEEHAEKDADGKPIIENGHYKVRDKVALTEDVQELGKEKQVIEGGDHREMIRTLQEVLRKFEDEEYGAQESEVYDYLCDQFKIDEEENEDE